MRDFDGVSYMRPFSKVGLYFGTVWPGDVVVRALDLRLRRSLVRVPTLRFQVTTLDKLFAHKCLCHQAV